MTAEIYFDFRCACDYCLLVRNISNHVAVHYAGVTVPAKRAAANQRRRKNEVRVIICGFTVRVQETQILSVNTSE